MCIGFSVISHAVNTYTKTLQVGKSFTISPYRPANTTPHQYHYYANDYNISNSSIVYISKESAGTETIHDGTLTLYFYKYKFIVFGQQSGETIIDIGYRNNSGNLEVYERYNVKVVDVKNISIPPSVSLMVGEQYTFSPTITDAEATTTLTWQSSNESVATITSEGVLTAKAVGSTEIICTAQNGVSARCVVTVNPVPATGISLNKTSVEMEKGGAVQLAATVSPSDATNKAVSWSSSSPDIAFVDGSGLVTAVKSGTCFVTATTLDGSNLSASCQVTVLRGADVKQGMRVWSQGLFEVFDINEVDSVSFFSLLVEQNTDTKEYVDLGLPSRTLWATCNVGARRPEDYGSYFAWGETEPKEEYSWGTYKWCNGSESSITKYNTADGRTELLLGDDAASANWGGGWKTPSQAQFDELFNSQYTTTQWTTLNGVAGRRITSKKNGRSIFLPAGGWRNGTDLRDTGSFGIYWSRTLDKGNPTYAISPYVGSGEVGAGSRNRCSGRSVRPVRVKLD